MNPGERLARLAQRSPERVALLFADRHVTFGDWDARANALAAWLAEQGVERRCPVALVLPNGPDFPLLHLAIMKLGAVAMPIDPRLGESELLALIEQSAARLTIVPEAFAREAALAGRTRVVTLGSAEVQEVLAGAASAPPIAAPEVAGDPALYLPTSGTTGRPRAVVLSYANLDCFPAALSAVLDTTERDILVMAVPMSHISGPILLNEILDKGSALSIPAAPAPSLILEAITRHRVTWMHSVPPIFQGMLRALKPDHDLSTLRIAAMMGTSVPIPVLRALAQVCPQAAIIQGYGLTETSPLLTLLPVADATRRCGSVGKAVPGAELRIVDEQGAELPAGEPGQLIARGPMLMDGYLNDEVASAERIRAGFFWTGDIMSRDEEGFYYHLGRADDMIVTGRGLNVFPAEVENALLTHPATHDVAVAGVETGDGLAVKAWVVLMRGSDASAIELRRHCSERLASFKVPKQISFADEIPRNPMNKVLRAELG